MNLLFPRAFSICLRSLSCEPSQTNEDAPSLTGSLGPYGRGEKGKLGEPQAVKPERGQETERAEAEAWGDFYSPDTFLRLHLIFPKLQGWAVGGRTQGSITKIQPPQAQDWATVLHSQTQPEQFMNVKMFQRSAQALFLPLLLSSLAPLKPHRAMVAQPKEGHSWALPSPCGLPRRGGGRQSWGWGRRSAGAATH